MDRHYCKQCGKPFNYCRGCMLTPIPYKAAGFCSTECSTAFKAPKVEIPQEVVEIEPIKEEVPEILTQFEIKDDGIHE